MWEGKSAKRKDHNKKTVISDINHRGLRTINFEIMNKALKIAWIKRITEHVHPA